jgi:hypothetical protein
MVFVFPGCDIGSKIENSCGKKSASQRSMNDLPTLLKIMVKIVFIISKKNIVLLQK